MGNDIVAQLQDLGVRGILLEAAAKGTIPKLKCQVPDCLCPMELGGPGYFEARPAELSDWMPTVDHFPRSKGKGGQRRVENIRLAHRLCNRVDASKSIGRSYAKDLARVEASRLSGDSRPSPPKGLPQSIAKMLMGPAKSTLRSFLDEISCWHAVALEPYFNRGNGPTGIRLTRGPKRFANVFPDKSLQFAHGGKVLAGVGLTSEADVGPDYQSMPVSELVRRLDEARLLAAYAYWAAGR